MRKQRKSLITRSTMEMLEKRTLLATITVTNTNDSGAGSLRQAITDANGNSNSDIIAFNISGAGVHTISPLTALPKLTEDVTIDGTTQSGYSGSPLIEISGGSAGIDATGIDILGATVTLKGLCINSFDGIGVSAIGVVDTCTIQANYIGTDPTGLIARPNLDTGVYCTMDDATIGGSSVSNRNIISANGDTPGGTADNGVTLYGNNITLQNNYIGVGADGTTPLGNANFGVLCTGGGDDELISGNVIAYNGSTGVLIPKPHTGNEITQNGIYANGGLGIDLQQTGSTDLIDGPTTNDPLDVDTGGNNIQNFPVITSAAIQNNGTELHLIGTLNSLASKAFRVEFFASRIIAAADREEGAQYIGQVTVNTNVSGDGTFDVTLNGTFSVLSSFTATATDTALHNTSEFSASVGAKNFAGTSAADTIAVTSLGANITVTINGGANTFPISDTPFLGLDGLAGNDTITIGPGVLGTFVVGGLGNDTITGGDNKDTLTGGGQNDFLDGGAGDDRLNGSGGKDFLLGNLGNDRLYGNEGNDVLVGAAGVDRLFAGDDNDILSGSGSNDKLFGELGDDILVGNDGNDILQGGDGSDNLAGQNGNDTMDGGAGPDIMAGGEGVDLIAGGGGNDRISGGPAADQILGGTGNDFIDSSGDSAADNVNGNAGTDTAVFDAALDILTSIEA